MATDALSIPFDITWQRLAWSTDMIDRSFGGGLPPKWRSSAAVYAYPVPLADTAEDYPDHRVVYLKVSASITGWSAREEILPPLQTWDEWQQEGWTHIGTSPVVNKMYWACIGAILQVAVYPRPEAGVADADYPFIVDFEPKKRELYEAVTAGQETLSGSSTNTSVRKGTTSTYGGELGLSLGPIGSSASYGYTREDVTTTDTSTERRETVGRTTQLSQMYQLFNGYHLGTNRAVFAIFPRPHTVSPAEQAESGLIDGQRKLEGIQDVFLIVQVPRSIPGICVRVHLDTAHDNVPTEGFPQQQVVTRRLISGCGAWNGDRLMPVPPPSGDVRPPRMVVVGEHEVTGWQPSYKQQVKSGRAARIEIANNLNQAAAELRQRMLADAASGAYAPVNFRQTATFARIASVALRRSATELVKLVGLGYVTKDELDELAKYGVAIVGALFGSSLTMPTITAVRKRLLDALANAPTQP